jgi:FkbM family methyltransferase
MAEIVADNRNLCRCGNVDLVPDKHLIAINMINKALGLAYRLKEHYFPNTQLYKRYPWITPIHDWIRGSHRNPYCTVFGKPFLMDRLDINGVRQGSPGNHHIVKYLKAHPPKIAADVGANIGYLTVLMSALAKRVYAFEPDERMFAHLKINTVDLLNVESFKCAVGSETGSLNFYRNPDADGDHSLVQGHGRVLNRVVDVVRLDDVIKEHGSEVFVKIDVQGFEKHVIDGMPRLISEGATIIMEWWPEGLELAGVNPSQWIWALRKRFSHVQALGSTESSFWDYLLVGGEKKNACTNQPVV